jgi:FkbM family methyltransferase
MPFLAMRHYPVMGRSALLSTLQRVLQPLPLRGKGRLSEVVFGVLPTSEAECHPWPNVTVHVRPNIWIERLMWAGVYEPDLVGLYKSVLRAGMTVLDVGANIGYFSALAAGLVGRTVFAFEPSPACFSHLTRNLAPFPTAQASQVAIGDQNGTAQFRFSQLPDETGWGSLIPDQNGSMQETEIPVLTLDSWAHERNLQRVDFLKIDVEGAEYRVLRGALETLSQYRPIVVAELNAVCLARDGRQPSDVLGLLRSVGYRNFAFNDGVLALPVPISREPSETIDRFSADLVDAETELAVAATR